MTAPFGFIPASSSALKKLTEQATGGGAQPPSNAPAPVNPQAPSRIPIGKPNDTNPSTPLQTLADTLLSALQSGPSVSANDNIGPAVITATNASGGTVDVKKIAILAAIALGAWFLWKKYGKKATS